MGLNGGIELPFLELVLSLSAGGDAVAQGLETIDFLLDNVALEVQRQEFRLIAYQLLVGESNVEKGVTFVEGFPWDTIDLRSRRPSAKESSAMNGRDARPATGKCDGLL